MKLTTKHFGEIEIDDSKILNFEDGVPGFEDAKKFILLKDEKDEDNLFYWIQSIDDGDLAFALIDMLKVMPDYDPMVPIEELSALGDFENKDLVNYNILVIPEDVKEMTANLLAPIVINNATKKGKQIISTNDYEVKYKIFELLKK